MPRDWLDSETIFLIPVSQAAHAKYIEGMVAIHKCDHAELKPEIFV